MKGNIMWFLIIFAMFVVTLTVSVSWLVGSAPILPIVGIALSSFAIGFVLGENTHG
jgi:hypothetical protein